MNGLLSRLDPFTAVIVSIFLPAVYVVLNLTRHQVKAGTIYIANGAFYGIAAALTRRAAARLTLRRICSIQLAGESKYLHVPSTQEIQVEVDKIFVPLVLEPDSKAQTRANRLRAIWVQAMATNAARVQVRFSKSLARRRLRPNQEKVRSTTQRGGNTAKPLTSSVRLTISIRSTGTLATTAATCRAL